MLTIYQASAGSGKTFTLAKRYISLLLAQRPAHAHRNILAVTFTHKATNEMKTRILRELYALGSGAPSAYRQELMRENACDAAEINRRAQHLLTDILQDYANFSISTIDSFFQQIVRSFAREIGLPGSYNVGLDTNDLLAQAIEQLFFELDKPDNATLLQWLTHFAEHKINDNKSWNPQEEMEKLGKEIFKENYQSLFSSTDQLLCDKQNVGEYRKTLKAIQTGFEQQLKQIGTAALQLIASHGLDIESFSYGKAGVMGAFVKLASGKTKELTPDNFPGKRFMDCLDNEDACYAKSCPADVQNAIRQVYQNGLGQLMHQVIDQFGEPYRNYYTARTIASNLDTVGIMSDLAAYIRKITENQNMMPLADTPLLLHKIIDGSDTPFIYEKTGLRIRHYMIDEFQDTSAMQWENFKPLIANSIATRNENLVVGDVKQSIYRWRNSDWTLLDSKVPEDKALEPQLQVLDTNWRSKRDIVEFNNQLFTQLPVLLKSELPDSYAARLAHAYENLAQKPHQSGSGYVQINFIEPTDEQPSWKATALDLLAQEIQHARQRGIALHEMAVLARTKAEVQEATQFLLEQDIPVVSSEGLLIANSPAVRFLLGLLYVQADPADSIHRTIANFEYAHEKQGLPPDEALLRATLADQWLFTADEQQALAQLSHAPLFDFVQQAAALFGVYEWQNAAVFVQAFVDYAFDYVTGKTADVHNFIEHWEQNGQKTAISMPEVKNAVQIMTVHKAKGLEFNCVFVPFCNWATDSRQQNTLWCRPSTEPFCRLSPVPVNYSSKLQNTIFEAEYQEERMQTYIDNLNVLYVAFTRPETELYAFCPKPEEKENKEWKNKDMSCLLWKCLAADTDDQFVFRKGSRETAIDCRTATPETGHIPAQHLSVPICSGQNAQVKLRTKSPASYQDEELSAQNRLSLGLAMHEILCNIKLRADEENVIQTLVDNGQLNRHEAGLVRDEMAKFWQLDNTADWFSGKYRVLTEAEILTPEGTVFRPDRLMIDGKRAIIVDYKFGNKKRPEHITQVRTYMQLVAQMGYETRGYIYYIEQNECTEVPQTAGNAQLHLFS